MDNNYCLPLVHYEPLPQPRITQEETCEIRERITTTFAHFGIGISEISVVPGPVISQWEIGTDDKAKTSQVKKLEYEILQSLSIPGSRLSFSTSDNGNIVLETPNKSAQLITFNAVVSSKEFADSNMELPIALGVQANGSPVVLDLAKMPNILIAGEVGTGKNNTQHSIICSLLCKKTPQELKFVFIDTRLVDLIEYETLTDFLATPAHIKSPIVKDIDAAIPTLNSLCALMRQRYDLLNQTGARNIAEYNTMLANGKLSSSQHEYMPYIVTVISEFSHCLFTAGIAFEQPLIRLAQMSRAVGIHLVISTERPSHKAITGYIKANFPCKIALRAASINDSYAIINQPGAERLIGKGDMLLVTGDKSLRLQGAYINPFEELPEICRQVISQNTAAGKFNLPEPNETEQESNETAKLRYAFFDILFEDVAKFVVENQIACTSMIQRKFSIGYNRVSRLMNYLQIAGIVEPIEGSILKKVIIADKDALAAHLKLLKSQIPDD